MITHPFILNPLKLHFYNFKNFYNIKMEIDGSMRVVKLGLTFFLNFL